jgi:hypothetical protein
VNLFSAFGSVSAIRQVLPVHVEDYGEEEGPQGEGKEQQAVLYN